MKSNLIGETSGRRSPAPPRPPVSGETGRTGPRPPRGSVALLGLAAMLLIPAAAGVEAGAQLGELGDPSLIEFAGNTTFTTEALRNALAMNAGYLFAAHPQNRRDSLLEILRSKIASGYRRSGFPGAQVAATVDPEADRIRVRIVEGRRFKCGAVKVTGAREALAAAIVERLSKSAATAASTTYGFLPQTEGAGGRSTGTGTGEGKPEAGRAHVATSASVQVTSRDTLATRDPRNALAAGPEKSSSPEERLWIPGDPADFGQDALDHFETIARNCLAEHGLFFPSLRARVRLQPATSTADLLVEVLEEGPQGRVTDIEVTGNVKNTRDDIIRFLGLKIGMPITRAAIASAEQELWKSARFVNYEIMPERPAGLQPAPAGVRLRIKVQECEPAPKLADPLSDEEQALVRLCNWLGGFASRSEDAVLSLSLAREASPVRIAADFVLSPREGLLARFKDPEAAAGTNLTYAVLLARQIMGLYAARGGYKLLVARPEIFTTVWISLRPTEPGAENSFQLTIGGGFKSASDAELKSGATPFRMDVKLAPAAFLKLARDPSVACAVTNNRFTLTVSNSVLTADAITGRVEEWNLDRTDAFVRLRFVTNAFERAKKELDAATAGHPNRFTPDHAASSTLGFIAGEIARWKLLDQAVTNLVPADRRRRAVAAVNQLLAVELLDRFGSATHATNRTESFVVAPDDLDQALAANNFAAVFSGIAFKYSNDLFPRYSWPWTLARESVFILAGRGTYADAELGRLYESEQTGPLGCLAIAQLLASMKSPTARAFATRGLARLTTADFRSDCRLFLAGDSGLARSFANVAARLKELPAEDVDALASVLPGAEAALLQEWAQALRADSGRPLAESLAPALDVYWEQSLGPKVRAALQKILAPSRSS